MSKNLTRKGLALGALVALGSSVIAGAPAQAANELTFAPKLGTAFAMPITDTFTFTAGLPSGSTGDISQLKYKVSTAGALTVNAVSAVKLANSTVATSAVGAANEIPASNVSTGVKAITSAAAGYVSGTADVITETVVAGAANDTYAHAYTVPTATSQNTLAISLGSAATTSTTQTVVVTAFLDSDGGGTLNGSEWSTEQTVTFVKYSELTTSGSITAPIAADLKVTASWKFTNVNNELIATTVKSKITKGDDTQLQDTAANDTVTAAAWDATDLFKVVNDGSNGTAWVTDAVGLAKGSAVKVQPILGSTNVGTAITAEVATRALSSLQGNAVVSTTAKADATQDADTSPQVLTNGEKKVYFLAMDTSTTAKPKAGVTVSVAVTITTATLSAATGVNVTINGTTYSSAATLPGATGVAKLALTTDADGKAYITYKTAKFNENEAVVFTATAENFTGIVRGVEKDAVYTQYVANHEVGATATDLTAVTTDGAAVKVDVIVQDQFGGAPADGKFQIAATAVATNQVTAATSGAGSSTYAAVVSGKASLSLVDNGTGKGTVVFGLVRYNVNADGVVSTPIDIAGIGTVGEAVTTLPTFSTTFATGAATVGTANNDGFGTRFNLVVKDAADIVAGEVNLYTAANSTTALGLNTAETASVLGSVVGGGTPAKLTYTDFKAVDMRSIAVTAPAAQTQPNADLTATTTDTSTTGKAVVYGAVASKGTSTYASANIPGATITVSGTGKQFVVTQDGKDIWGTDSLTFVADADGRFAVGIYSHLAGKQLVTITSGAGKSVVELVFADAVVAATKTVSVKVADGAAQFQSGRALDVVVSVADKFGNPIATTGAAVADDGHLVVAQSGAGYLSVSGNGGTTVKTDATGSFKTKLITNAGDLGTSTITATVDLPTVIGGDATATNSSEFGITDVTDISSAGKAIYVNTEFAKGKVVTVYIDGKRMPVKAAEATDNAVERKYTQKKAGKHTVTVRVSGGVVASETVVTTK